MDYLCEDDKNLQTIDMLIRFIETRRADSIKEALQEYDKLLVNKQMLELEKQKVEAELKRAALEHDDRIKKWKPMNGTILKCAVSPPITPAQGKT